MALKQLMISVGGHLQIIGVVLCSTGAFCHMVTLGQKLPPKANNLIVLFCLGGCGCYFAGRSLEAYYE